MDAITFPADLDTLNLFGIGDEAHLQVKELFGGFSLEMSTFFFFCPLVNIFGTQHVEILLMFNSFKRILWTLLYEILLTLTIHALQFFISQNPPNEEVKPAEVYKNFIIKVTMIKSFSPVLENLATLLTNAKKDNSKMGMRFTPDPFRKSSKIGRPPPRTALSFGSQHLPRDPERNTESQRVDINAAVVKYKRRRKHQDSDMGRS